MMAHVTQFQASALVSQGLLLPDASTLSLSSTHSLLELKSRYLN